MVRSEERRVEWGEGEKRRGGEWGGRGRGRERERERERDVFPAYTILSLVLSAVCH